MQAEPIESIPVLQEIQAIWTLATPDSIGRDLERARKLAALAPPQARLKAETLIHELERLERWIRHG